MASEQTTGRNFPLLLVSQLTRGRGHRYPKRPPKAWGQNSGWTPFVRVGDGPVNPWEKRNLRQLAEARGRLRASPTKPATLLGNLEPWEFRFWIGSKHRESLKAECRGCGEVTHGSIGRRAHHRVRPCMARVSEALNQVRKDKLCLVCDKPCADQRLHGLPLHPNCVEPWCFDGDIISRALEWELERLDAKARKDVQEAAEQCPMMD